MPDIASAILKPAPFTSRYINANGVKLHLLDYGGEGKRPLLCLHGGGAHAHWFDFVASAFISDFHVLALDQRGHGDSAWAEPPEYGYDAFVADLQQIVEKVGGRNTVLMGHSMGGMISLLYTSKYPDGLSGLIIIDSTLQISSSHEAERKARALKGGRAYGTLEEYVANFRLRPERTMATAEMLRYIAAYSPRRYDDSLWRHKIDRRIMADRTAMDGVPHWSRVSVPALLVKARLSKRLTPAIIAGIQKNCPHVELVEVPDSEHHVTLDNPAGLRPVVSTFLHRHFSQDK